MGIFPNSPDRTDFKSLTAKNSVIIGERLDTDIRLGLEAGIATVLVLSGATTEMKYQENSSAPTFVINSVFDLLY